MWLQGATGSAALAVLTRAARLRLRLRGCRSAPVIWSRGVDENSASAAMAIERGRMTQRLVAVHAD